MGFLINSYIQFPASIEPTFEDEFDDSTGWTLGSGQSIESGYLYADGTNIFSYKSFAIGEPTDFLMDFNYAPVDGDPRITYILLNSESAGYGAATEGNKRVVFLLNQHGMATDFRYYITGSGVEVENHGLDNSGTRAPTDGTISYYRMIKDSDTFTLKRYDSDADRSTDTNAQQSLTMLITVDGYTNTADLAYLVVGGYGTYAGYSRNAKLYNWAFYSGVTSI
jgi:hypothetical protein